MVKNTLEFIILGTDREERPKTYVVLSIFTNGKRSYHYTTWRNENRDSLLGYVAGVLYGSVDDCKDTDIIRNGFSQDICERFGDFNKEKISNKLNVREFENITKYLKDEVCVSLGGHSFLEDREEECWLCNGRGSLLF